MAVATGMRQGRGRGKLRNGTDTWSAEKIAVEGGKGVGEPWCQRAKLRRRRSGACSESESGSRLVVEVQEGSDICQYTLAACEKKSELGIP